MVKNAEKYYHQLINCERELAEICSNSNISKSFMEYLEHLQDELDGELPKEFDKCRVNINKVLKEMYNDLLEHKDMFFVDNWNLTKVGRKRIRECIEKLPSIRYIHVPKNNFTNVPDDISFSNRVWYFQSEYRLSISLAGSCLWISCLDNKDVRIDFTEHFLDRIILTVQFEKLDRYLNEKNRERDNSIYQDFKLVLVSVGWRDYELNLNSFETSNPFIEISKLVWEEYGNVLKEKNLVLPWFRLLNLVDNVSCN